MELQTSFYNATDIDSPTLTTLTEPSFFIETSLASNLDNLLHQRQIRAPVPKPHYVYLRPSTNKSACTKAHVRDHPARTNTSLHAMPPTNTPHHAPANTNDEPKGHKPHQWPMCGWDKPDLGLPCTIRPTCASIQPKRTEPSAPSMQQRGTNFLPQYSLISCSNWHNVVSFSHEGSKELKSFHFTR